MIKKILILLFTAVVISSLAFFTLWASRSSEKAPLNSQVYYAIGDQVADAGGSLWEYRGKTILSVGQISPDLELLTVFCCNREKRVLGIHKETIPNATLGDLFILITPSKAFLELITLKQGISPKGWPPECNVSISDPPAGQVLPLGGDLCCLWLSCDD